MGKIYDVTNLSVTFSVKNNNFVGNGQLDHKNTFHIFPVRFYSELHAMEAEFARYESCDTWYWSETPNFMNNKQ